MQIYDYMNGLRVFWPIGVVWGWLLWKLITLFLGMEVFLISSSAWNISELAIVFFDHMHGFSKVWVKT